MRLVGQEPIFIVGAPRSGTTLLAAMLAAHSRLSCGPETRFFRFLDKANLTHLFASWPENAIDFLFSITLIDPIPEHYGITRERLHTFLQEGQPRVPAILSALTEQFMVREGKKRWIEKSPENLMYVEAIREYFPRSPIIRIIRDPRDTALSMVKWPHGPQDFLEALFFWQQYDQRSASFFEDDGNCFTLQYEHLVQAPEAELRRLCAFIDEEYEPGMMNTSKSAAKVVTEREQWKHLVGKPIDQSRVQTWKRELSQEENRMAEALIGDRLVAYGYESVHAFPHVATVYPSIELLLQHGESLALFVAQGVRFWRTARDERNHLAIYIGEPDRDRWLRYKKPLRWWDTVYIAVQVLKAKLTHRSVYWLRDREAKHTIGICSRLLSFVFGITEEPRIA